MATYAIGDIQGCYHELQQLLAQISFDKTQDRLWFTGDLVNRGPQSLDVLRFVQDLEDRAVTVLGNHDLHLLALARGNNAKSCKDDTLAEILQAPDKLDLLDWLRQRPLLHHDPDLNYTLLHAGLPPQWNLALAQDCADEVAQTLRGPQSEQLFANIYGDDPASWDPGLSGWERLRFIVNCLTRLRYCSRAGLLCLGAKGPPGTQPAGFLPWFAIKERQSTEHDIVFGHWSTLHMTPAQMSLHHAFGLDTGCLWGGALTAMRLEDRSLFEVASTPSEQSAAGKKRLGAKRF